MFTTDGGDYYPDRRLSSQNERDSSRLDFSRHYQRNFASGIKHPRFRRERKLVAFVSIVLWVGAILAGVEIAAFQGWLVIPRGSDLSCGGSGDARNFVASVFELSGRSIERMRMGGLSECINHW